MTTSHSVTFDAVSFITMRRLGIQEALTFDQDFAVAGFTLAGDQ
jgi:predicted nucleic acid-binding protein